MLYDPGWHQAIPPLAFDGSDHLAPDEARTVGQRMMRPSALLLVGFIVGVFALAAIVKVAG